MAKFYDGQNRPWRLAFDNDTLARLRRNGIAAERVTDGTLLIRMGQDLEFRGQVYWMLLEPQLVERGMSAHDFARMMKENEEAAADALIEAQCDALPADHPARAGRSRDSK